MAVNSFIDYPKDLNPELNAQDISLIGIPLLCDLAVDVRAKKAIIDRQVAMPNFNSIFDDIIAALLDEQDAYWNRNNSTKKTVLQPYRIAKRHKNNLRLSKSVVLGFSGGKDSIVTLFSLLASNYKVYPVLLNEGDRTWQDIRQWIPKLRRLGLKPLVFYLNTRNRNKLWEKYGEWYRSSYQIGWITAILALTALKTGSRLMCLGIESTPDIYKYQSNGHIINHQYQKTTAHMQKLELFYNRVLHKDLKISSPISGLSDSEIIKLLISKVPPSFQYFSSCGSSNWRSKHCCICEKCAYTFVLLYLTEKGRTLSRKIFRQNMLKNIEAYRPWLDARYGYIYSCVGQKIEVWNAMESLYQEGVNLPVIDKWAKSNVRKKIYLKNRSQLKRNIIKIPQLAKPIRNTYSLLQSWLKDI